jgi:multimeric flavodoxin WrbA
MVNEIIDRVVAADGLLLGSPTYFSDVTANMRAFIERCGFVARANDYLLKRKVGASVVAVRRAGAIPAFSSMNLFLHYMQMIQPGSSYWNIGIGRDMGDVLKDPEGLQTMRDLGANMAWLMKKLAGGDGGHDTSNRHGPVQASQLGLTLIHEHVLFGTPAGTAM